MVDETKVNLPKEAVEDELLPAEIDTVPLEKETTTVINNIVKSESTEELKSYVDMFKLNIAKKNAVRIAKYQNLLDAVVDQGLARAEKHPDEFTNKEIIDYIKVMQEQINTSKDAIEHIEDQPLVQINNQKNEVNINLDSGLSRESKTKVIDAIRALVQQVTAPEAEEELYNNNEDSDEEDVD